MLSTSKAALPKQEIPPPPKPQEPSLTLAMLIEGTSQARQDMGIDYQNNIKGLRAALTGIRVVEDELLKALAEKGKVTL